MEVQLACKITQDWHREHTDPVREAHESPTVVQRGTRRYWAPLKTVMMVLGDL